MKKMVCLVIAMMLALVSVGALADFGTEDLEYFPKGSKVGFDQVTLGAEFFSALDDTCRKYFTENGYEYISMSYEANTATQVTDIENMINMGCDAILYFVSEEAAVLDVSKKGLAAGVKMYPVATWIHDRDAYTWCIGTDQRATGVGAAQMAADWIDATFPDAADGSIEVVVIGNTQTAESTDRTNGFYEVENFTSKAKVVDMFDLSGATNANIKTQEYTDIILSKYPDFKVILAYGVDTELGANEVLMRTPGLDYDHIAIFGVDTSLVAYQLIADSVNNGSVLRGTFNLGSDLAMDMYNLVTGQFNSLADENGYISSPGTPVTTANVAEFLAE